MAKQWFPHYVGDYMRDTGHLTLVEDGAYRRLLDYYYSSGGPLPDDEIKLRRICRAFEDQEKEAIVTVLDQFFTLKNGFWHNQRADKELEKADTLSSKNSENAKKRWRSKRNATAMRPHMRSECQNDASTTTTTSTTTDTPTTTESLRSQGVGADYVDDVCNVMNCQDSFRRLQPIAIARMLKDGRENPRHKKNLHEFIIDASNSLDKIKNPTGMLRAYLAREDKPKQQKKGKVELSEL